MIHAYQEMYLSKAQSILGDAFDYAINTCGIDGNDFIKLFTASTVCGRMENGEPTYLTGKSGIEIASEVISETTDREISKYRRRISNAPNNTESGGMWRTINGIRAEDTVRSSRFFLLRISAKCTARFTKRTSRNLRIS